MELANRSKPPENDLEKLFARIKQLYDIDHDKC